MAASLASVVTTNCRSKSGNFRTGAVANVSFNVLNALCWDSDHSHFAPLHIHHVSGRAISLNPLMNFL